MNDTAYYLYCLAPSGAALELSQTGVFVEDPGRIRAVLSEVRREDFAGEAAEKRLQDLAWLAPRAALHEAVVEQVMCQSPVLPVPFATLFESRESVRRFVEDHGEPIVSFFHELGDKREWAVKGLLHRAPPQEIEAADGKTYLSRKRSAVASKASRRDELRAACEAAAAMLMEQADAFQERKAWEPDVIFNWAFLLGPQKETALRGNVAKLEEEHRALGLRLVISGPWPPYSFAPPLGPQ